MKAGLKLVLVVVSLILIVSLAVNGYLYFTANNRLSENNNLQKKVTNLQSQVTSLESQTDSLKSQVENLKNISGIDNQTIANLNAQILDLQTQNSNLLKQNDNLTFQVKSQLSTEKNSKPFLVTALGATFTWSYSSTAQYGMLHYLYVQGTVTNTGSGTAYNCDLKVIMNTTSGLSFTDYYRFNALAPGEVENVDTHLYHENIQSWQIFPEWTNTP